MTDKKIELAQEILAHKERWPLFNLPEKKVLKLAELVLNQKPISQRECYQRGYVAGRQEQREQDAKMVEERGKKLGRAIDPAITAKAIRRL